MSIISHHKKSAGLLLLLTMLFFSFGGWVVTSPEFQDSSNGRTLITRINEGAQARMNQAYDVVRGRITGRSSKNRSSQSALKKVTGPASVLVVDNLAKPIKDVTVVFKSRTDSISVRSDSKGRVNARLPLGEYQVSLSDKRYSSEVRTGQKVLGPDNGFFLSVILETRVTIKGVVVTEEGKPVPGASVGGQRNWLQQFSETGSVFLDDASYPTITTDDKGAFHLPDVSIGSNTFAVALRGYAPAEIKTEVPAGGLAKDLKFILKRPSEISGRVIDEEAKPVKGVKVTAVKYLAHGQESIDLPTTGFVTSTNDEGGFKLSKLFSDGYYLLRFEQPLYAMMEVGNVNAGTNGMQLVLQRGGEISGRVAYLDRESTAARVLIQAQSVIGGTTVTRTTMSNATGDFAFDRLPYGGYSLTVDFNKLVNEPRLPITSMKDRPSTGNLLEVYQASHLAGQVIDAYSGQPIPDARISVRASYGFSRTRIRVLQAKADSHGTFAFDRLPGGTHQVTAKAEGYLPTSGNPADYTIPIDPGDNIKDYQVFLSEGGVIHGQVVNQDGQGIGNSDVQLYVASGSFNSLNVKDMKASTDGAGFFEFRDFPIGQRLTLYVSATKDGYAKKHSELIDLSPQQPEAVTQVMLSPGGVVSGRVTDTENRPLYGVKITFDSREFPGDPGSSEFYTFTDTDGNYLLERCSPGRAILVADREDFVRQTKGVTIPEGRLLSRQNFKMKISRNITGTLADFKGNPIADATVRASPLPKATGSGADKTNKKGEFEIKGLSEGSFRLEASFTLTTPEGKQDYTFIVPEAPSGAVGIPVDCDVQPNAVAQVLSTGGRSIGNFTATLRSKLDVNPSQLFRFNLVRPYTQASGLLRLSQVPRGLYTLKIEAPGYETWYNEELIIGPGNRTHLPTIRLKPASTISGRVISATTGKPVQGALIRILDDGEQEVKTVNRIELQAYQRSDILERLTSLYDDDLKYDPDPNSRLVARVRGNVVTTKQTNVYGKFSVDDLDAGNYTVDFEHPSFRPKRLRNIRVGRGKNTDLGDIDLQPGGVIHGKVIDLEGNGISDAAIQVRGEIQGRNRASTDVAGNFVLRGIGFGDWPVSVIATLNGKKVYAWKRVSVRPDETSDVEFVLETSSNVTGAVQLPAGRPISGTVRLYYVDDTGTVMDDIVYSSSINGGNYTINAIPPGRYFVITNGRGARGPFAFWTWMDLQRGRNSVPLSVLSASMSGLATNVISGEAVAGATVQVNVDVNGVIVPGSIQNLLKISDGTDAAGKYLFPYLQSGTYRIWAGGPGSQIIPVDSVNVSPGQSISGYKVAVTGAP